MRPSAAIAGCLTSILVMIVLAGCGGQATQRYQAGPSGPPARLNFDSDPSGAPPATATVFSGSWVVRPEPGAPTPPNALCQTSSAEFPAIALGTDVYTDAVLTVRFKPISGQADQAAGLIFRVQDGQNYYILRANALEGNVNLYKYTGGQRSQIGAGSSQVRSGQWQELRVEVKGRHLKGLLDSAAVVEADDETFKAGRVGLWTKADSVTCFDDFSVAPA